MENEIKSQDKEMKSLMRVLIIGLIATVYLKSYAQTSITSVQVDTEKSVLEWTGKKLSGEHYGELKLISGFLNFTNNRLTGGQFEIDMNSIVCLDITDAKSNKRLIDHLKSEDFFGVSRFPKAKFEITKAVYRSETEYEITGNLTIKEKTNAITFSAVMKSVENVSYAEALMVVDRSKFDIKFGSQSFFENLADKLVYDDMDIKVRLVLR
jgi:polyisoprenoid-binding protein YceI